MTGSTGFPSAVVAHAGEPISATGVTFALHEWAHGPNAGPPLHVHHYDDEAWHVLEGVLRFRFGERTVDIAAGGTAFVPAGVAHTFSNPGPADVRYLAIMTGKILQLIGALHEDTEQQSEAAIYQRYDAEVVE